MSGLGAMVVKLVLEARQFRTELAQTAADAEAHLGRAQSATQAITGAVQEAVTGQMTATSAATRALTVLGPLGAAAAAVAVTAAAAYHQAGLEALGFERAIAMTGNSAGVTANSLADMARGVDAVVGTQALAAQTLTEMAAGGKIAGENLQSFAQVAIEVERSLGQSIDKTVDKFNDLGDAPTKASQKLNESLNYLTSATYAQIKAAEDLGEKERAASIAQKAYASSMRERAAEVDKHLGTLQRAWRGVKDIAKDAWDAMLNIGREDTTRQRLASATLSVESLQAKLRSRQERGLATGDIAPQLAAAQELEKSLREAIRLEETNAAAKSKKVKLERDHIEFISESDRYLSKQEQMERAVLAERTRGEDLVNAKLITRQELEERIAKVRERFAEKGGKGGGKSEEEKQLEREEAAVARNLGLNTDYLQQLQLLQSARERGTISEERYIEAVLHLISVQPMAKKLIDEQTKADTAAAKALEQHAKERDKFIVSLVTGLEKIKAETQAQKEHNARLGLGVMAVADLDAAKLDMLATDKELAAIKVLDKNLDEQQYQLLMDQARAYRELAQAKREGAQRQVTLDMEKAGAEAARRTQDTWDRTAERIGDSLTDSLMRGFEAGKSGADNFRDTLVNMFKSMVLRPTISFLLSPVSQLLSGLFGMGGGGAGQSIAGGGGFSLGSLGNLWSGITNGVRAGFTNAFSSFAESELGARLGLSVPTDYGTGFTANVQTPFAQSLGSGLGMLGNGLAGYGLSSMISGGYTTGGNTVNVLAGIASAFLGPLAGVVGGLINRAFGRKLKDVGIEGEFGGEEGFTGRSYQFYKGGWFRSDKTTYSELDADVQKPLADSFKAMRAQVAFFADSLGLDASRLEGFTSKIKISTNGLNEEQIQAKFQEALATANNELAQQVIGTWETTSETVRRTVSRAEGTGEDMVQTWEEVDETITTTTYKASEYAKEGEKAIDTLQRLSTSLLSVNGAFEALGYTLLEASLKGADAASKIVDAFGSVDQFLASTNRYMDLFYSPEEKTAASRRLVDKELGKLNIATPTTIEEYRQLVEAQDLNTEAGRRAFAVLVQLAPTFYEVANSAQELEDRARALANAELDSAYSALERAVAARRKAIGQERQFWQETADSLSGLVTLLRDRVRGLRGEVAATAAMQAQQGNAFISQALLTAQTRGVLPDQNALEEAITAAQSGLDARNYATLEEWERDRLILANKLEDLEGMGAEQLSTADRMLKAFDRELEILDEQLDTYKKLVEEAKGNVEATLSVAEAVRAIDAKLFPDKAPGGAGGNSKPTGEAGFGPGASGGGSAAQKSNYKTPTATLSGGLVIYDYETDASRIAHLDKLAPVFHKYDGTGDLVGLAAEIKANGGTARDLAYLYGFTEKDVNNALDEFGIPRFDVGINRVPQDMTARIHKDELIVPADLNPFNPAASMPWGVASGNTRLESIMSGVLQAVGRCVTAAQNSALSVASILDHLDDWAETGLPPTRTEVSA